MIDKNLNIFNDVCTGCSACTEACSYPNKDGVFPINLIKLDNNLFVPKIDHDICTNCKACYRACPTEDHILKNDKLDYLNYINTIDKSYYGYSLDENHRYKASTAGITTEIASYLLDTKQIDGVLSSYQDDKTNEIISKIFTDSKQIKKTTGSIYRQVNLLNGLDKKIKQGGFKKLLIIGLPCHIRGITTLVKTNKYLKKNISFITIALFCKQTKTEEFSILQRNLLKAESNEKIFFRGNGWPGITKVKDKIGIKLDAFRISFNWQTFTFTPLYCFTCSDPLGTESDISIGDAWLDKYRNDSIGSSLIIANSILGDNILKKMKDKKKIYLKLETKENIIKSQSEDYIKFKTSYPKKRASYFGLKNNLKDIKSPSKYTKLMLLIKVTQVLFEFLERYKIMNYLPNILIKVFLKIHGIGFKYFSKYQEKI